MKASLYRNLIEPLYWKSKGLDVYKRYKEFAKCQWDSKDVFNRRQKIKIANLLTHAFNITPYYKENNKYSKQELREKPIDVLHSLPIVDKEMLMNNMSRFYVDLGRGTYKNSTGGSTGTPLIIMQDKVYLEELIATTILTYEWAGKIPGDMHIKLWGAPRDLINNKRGYKQILFDLLFRRKTLNSFGMGPDTQRKYLNIIKNSKPKILEGYADSLYEIAKAGERYNIDGGKPDAIVSSAGALHDHMRAVVESYFSSSVFDRYGSREAGNMASECEYHNGLHIMGETTYIEVVDESGNHVNEGEEGRILVTKLNNYTMPLIRYEIGDMGILGGEKCACGRPYPILQKVIGRQSGSFIRSDGGVVSPVFFIQCIGVFVYLY